MSSKLLQQAIRLLIKAKPRSREQAVDALRQIAGKLKIDIPPKSELVAAYEQLLKQKKIKPQPLLRQILVKRAVRTLSGVSVITVLTKPWACPGRCIYCPLEKGMPKSYLSNEPAAQRAFKLHFNPMQMVSRRIEALENNGHQVDKIELIVLGGTWSAYPRVYQNSFVTKCFYAANVYGSKSKRKIKSLAAEQKLNETAKYKIIGLTLETRPDQIMADEIKNLRRLGCTRVQLGVQHTDDQILKLIKRGQTLADAVKATKMLKEVGLKVDHHYMPDLPSATPAKDLAMFKQVFSSPDLQPDQIKIYPCVVNKQAELYKWFKTGKYQPYKPAQLFKLLLAVKKLVPPYIRINRLVRDIPEESIVAGNRVTNLRQYLAAKSAEAGWRCQCLHCREVRGQISDAKAAKLFKQIYCASDGEEQFLSFEDKNRTQVLAFLRLRFNDDAGKNIFPELRGAAIIRELHVYGQMTPARRNFKSGKTQHIGFGSRLMAEAERIARKKGYKKIAVIAGIGVRGYYKKLGYRLEGTYMVKDTRTQEH